MSYSSTLSKSDGGVTRRAADDLVFITPTMKRGTLFTGEHSIVRTVGEYYKNNFDQFVTDVNCDIIRENKDHNSVMPITQTILVFNDTKCCNAKTKIVVLSVSGASYVAFNSGKNRIELYNYCDVHKDFYDIFYNINDHTIETLKYH